MVRSIIKNKDRFGSPVRLKSIQVLAESNDKEEKSVAIVSTLIYSEIVLPITAYSPNHINLNKSPGFL